MLFIKNLILYIFYLIKQTLENIKERKVVKTPKLDSYTVSGFYS